MILYHKYEKRGMIFSTIPLFICGFAKRCRFDSAENEQKSSADEREVYKGTPSEETGIEQKTIPMEENVVFNLNTLSVAGKAKKEAL